MSTIEVPTEVPAEAPVPEATKSRHELFKWSRYVHVGGGAETCEHREDGACTEPDHFHAWVRLPNPLQMRDISDKARAAQARYRKLLADENSDPRVVIEAEIMGLYNVPKEQLVEEVIDRDFSDDYTEAMRRVDAREVEDFVPEGDEPTPRVYEHIEQDREEYARQAQLPEEQRGEEFAQLEATMAEYGTAIEREMAAIQKPKREAQLARPVEELVDVIRKDRMDHRATEIFLHTFNSWQWFASTYKPRKSGTPNERVWGDYQHMKNDAPPEVIEALRDAFGELESELQASRRGKGS